MKDEPRGRADKIVAIGLFTEQELKNVGTGLKRLYPITDGGDFDDLLQALDRAAKKGDKWL
jgi:hypothetical protein